MRIAFLILVFIHGIIHFLGFVKGFGLKDVKELTMPISKQMATMWLTAAVLFIVYGIMYASNSRYSWLVGLLAILISQVLIFSFWSDARFGTIPNLFILIVVIISFASYNFQKKVNQETNQILAQNQDKTGRIISENDILHLPQPIKKWLRHSGVVGKEYIKVAKVWQQAEMKMKPEQEEWMPATAIQYTAIDNPAFIWTVNMKMNSVLYAEGRDKFENGKGEMLIKINSLFEVANEQGNKLDEGTLQRFLGEMVWFPSLALSPYITWEQISDTAVVGTMNYKGTKGSGTFTFNSEGDFTKFSALRFKGNEEDAKRYEWILSVEEYKTFDGIKIPAKMTASWRLDEGIWTWLKLEIMDIKYNDNVHN